MNNMTVGGIDPRTGAGFAYYETMGGGMPNSLKTPVEALEHAVSPEGEGPEWS